MTITLYKYKFPFPKPSEWDEEVKYDYLKELEPIGFVDDFISCIFQRSWTGIGEWQIVMPKSSPHIKEFYDAQFIKLHPRAAGIINLAKVDINEQEQTVTFSGYELKGIYKQRISQGDPDLQVEERVGLLKSFYGMIFTQGYTYPTDQQPPNYDRWIPCDWGTLFSDRTSVAPVIKFTPPTDNIASIVQSLSETYDDGWSVGITKKTISTQERSKNMINPQLDLTTHYCLNETGAAEYNSTYCYTKYYPVEAGQEYYFYGTGSFTNKDKRVHGYASQSEDSWVAQLGLASNVSSYDPYEIHFTVPIGVNYIRCSYCDLDRQVMLELAPKTEYTDPYIFHYHTGEAIIIQSSIAPLDCTKDQEMEDLPKGMPLILSYDLNTVYTSSLEINKSQPNFAYVLGGGIRGDRQIGEVSSDNSNCLDRNEVVIDARDITEQSYLISKGQEYLAKYGSKYNYRFEASPYIINRYPFSPNSPYIVQDISGLDIPEDKNVELGVYGTLVDDELGVEQDFEITAITEVYDANGFHLELELGYDNTNINGKFNVFSAQTQSLLNSPISQLGVDKNGNVFANNGITVKGDYPYLHLTIDRGNDEFTDGVFDANENWLDIRMDEYDTSESMSSRGLRLYSPSYHVDDNDALEYCGNTVLHTGNLNSIFGDTIYDKIQAKKYIIKDESWPAVTLYPQRNNVSCIQKFEGSYSGEASMQAWTDDTGDDRTILTVYDPNAKTNVKDRLCLRVYEGGTQTKYNVLTAANVADYATSFKASQVSNPITWDSTYVNTATDTTTYTMYALGNIRVLRVRIYVKSALTATTIIGTIKSGNRPTHAIYMPITELNKTENDVRPIYLGTNGNIQLYNHTKASTYYGTIIYFVP